MQGEVIIGTKLDKRQLEKDLKDAEKELNQLVKEEEKLSKEKLELDVDVKNAEFAFKEVEQYINDLKLELSNLQLKGVPIDSYEYEQVANELKEMEMVRNAVLNQIEEKYKNINNAMNENLIAQEKTNQKINQMKAELQQSEQFDNIKNSINDVGNSLTSIIKKVGRWSLSLIGINSIISFINRSISTISQHDEKLANDIQYITYLLASILKPILEWIIKLVYTLLAYIRYIAKAWFNVDLFANASTEAFQKQNKAMKETAGSAKELRKTLMGFDEMNILQDNGDVTYGSGLDDLAQELQNLDDIPIPEIVKGIGAMGVGARTALKGLKPYTDFFKGFSEGLQTMQKNSAITFAKIGQGFNDLAIGIINGAKGFVNGFVEGLQTMQFNAATIFGKIGKNIGEFINGFVKGINNMQIEFGKFFGNLGQKLNDIVSFVSSNVVIPISTMFGQLWKGMWNGFIEVWNNIISTFSNIFSTIENALKGMSQAFEILIKSILQLFDWLKQKVTEIFNGLWNGVKLPLEKFVENVNKTLKKISMPTINVGVGLGKFFNIFGEKGMLYMPPKLALGGIINQPGRGVPIGSAIGGERGMEGVLPLTDAQQMSLLGEAIGKYITINANITNSMNGRIISRELQRIQNENDFAYNE